MRFWPSRLKLMLLPAEWMMPPRAKLTVLPLRSRICLTPS
jgi:hypothetical protein